MTHVRFVAGPPNTQRSRVMAKKTVKDKRIEELEAELFDTEIERDAAIHRLTIFKEDMYQPKVAEVELLRKMLTAVIAVTSDDPEVNRDQFGY